MRELYEKEIRDYLLARLEKRHADGALPTLFEATLPTCRITDWWIFEGRRYVGLEDSLALVWPHVIRQIEILRRTYNPRWRSVQAPEGEVDWVATALATATNPAPEYVCRTSRLGLSKDEHAALEGWCTWMASRWRGYCASVDVPAGALAALPWQSDDEPSELQLRRWALTARRSRWPLLRNVVAESLRVIFEPSLLDRVPLPAESSSLFELICLVRVLRSISPNPTTLRWLDHAASRNHVVVEGAHCWYQHSFTREDTFRTPEFDQPLIAATERHQLRVHRDIDVLVEFDEPRVGFDGIILEAKSGQQSYDEAVAQLKHYRALIKRERGGRWLVWGVKEAEEPESVTMAALRSAADEVATGDDVWFFSPASAIPLVLRTLQLC